LKIGYGVGSLDNFLCRKLRRGRQVMGVFKEHFSKIIFYRITFKVLRPVYVLFVEEFIGELDNIPKVYYINGASFG
jgi:hypothetical protein